MSPHLRTPARVGALLLVAVLAVGGCGGQDTTADRAPDAPGSSTPSTPSETPSQTPSDPSSPSDAPGPDSDRTACDAVVEGIDAFNADDYDATVEAFVDAVPLAEAELEEARSTGTSQTVQQASLLLEAVQWYAALPAEEYAEAFRDSLEFKRYQAITLGQCGDGQAPGAPGGPGDDGGVEA